MSDVPTEGNAVMDYDYMTAMLDWLDQHPEANVERLPVSEVFGPTIQGEGPHAGRTCHFIRLGGCNLSCSWCDTPYSTGQHGIPLSTVPRVMVDDVVAQIPHGAMVVLTGGEPLMHARRAGFRALLVRLKNHGCEVHVETNGTIVPHELAPLFDHITVSPKLGAPMRNQHHNPTLGQWDTWET
ncbi:7-carboxy-7-deazaguanine synthase QueE, partial [Cutibacterium acnes]